MGPEGQKNSKKTATVSSVIKLKEITFKIYELLKSKKYLNCLPFFYRLFPFHILYRVQRANICTTLCAMINEFWSWFVLAWFWICFIFDWPKKGKEIFVYYARLNSYLCAIDIYWIWQQQIYRIREMIEKNLRAHYAHAYLYNSHTIHARSVFCIGHAPCSIRQF